VGLGLPFLFLPQLSRCLLSIVVLVALQVHGLLREKVEQLLRAAESVVFVPWHQDWTQKLVTELILLLIIEVYVRDPTRHLEEGALALVL